MSAYSDAVLADSPLAYWRHGDAGSTAADSSGNGRNATYSGVTVGATSLIPSDTADNAATYDGVDDSASFSSASWLPNVSPITIEAWVKPSSIPAGRAVILSRTGSWAAGMNSSGKLEFLHSGVGAVTSTSVLLASGVTNHVVIVYRSVDLDIDFYLDGSLVETVAASLTPSAGSDDGKIGVRNAGEFFPGVLDEVAVYNTNIGSARVAAHYAAATAVAATPNVQVVRSALRF